MTTVIEKVRMIRKPASAVSSPAVSGLGASTSATSTGMVSGGRADHQAPAPEAVDDAPAEVGPDRARDEHRGQRRVARALAGAELVDEPQRDEGLQAEVDARAQRDDAAEAHERVPVVLVAIVLGDAARDVRGLLGGDRAQAAELAREHDARRSSG